MWGKWNEERKRIEDSPYNENFARLLWSAEALNEKNKEKELNLLVSDLLTQATAQDEFFNQLKEERMNESEPIVLYGGVLVPLLVILASLTRPRKTQPVEIANT